MFPYISTNSKKKVGGWRGDKTTTPARSSGSPTLLLTFRCAYSAVGTEPAPYCKYALVFCLRGPSRCVAGVLWSRGDTDELHTGESRSLRWPLPEPPLVPPALCKPRRQPMQLASAAPGAAAAGCKLDAQQSPRAASPAGLGASRRGRPRDAPWRAREHTRACRCALACASVRSPPPPPTWSVPEAKACPFGVQHARVARASALLDGAVLHELPVVAEYAARYATQETAEPRAPTRLDAALRAASVAYVRELM